MPNIYCHHSGITGERDFLKTVLKEVDISTVAKYISDATTQTRICESLLQDFPTGKFNVWGVPNGAESVIKKLARGDYVLLIGKTEQVGPGIYDGDFTALCEVKEYWSEPLPNLSKAFWGEHNYPRIFVFKTEILRLTWQEFLLEVGYRDSYFPQGHFSRITPEHFNVYGGASEYAKYLRANHIRLPDAFETVTKRKVAEEIDSDDSQDIEAINRELEAIRRKLSTEPQLKDRDNRRQQTTISPVRNTAFKIAVRKIYNHQCAICSLGLYSPTGKAEVESAHIYPRELNGSDDVRNGLCLCHFHHWAFDYGCIAVNDDYRILIYPDLPDTQDYDAIQRYKGKLIQLPTNTALRPAAIYLSAHRKKNGFA